MSVNRRLLSHYKKLRWHRCLVVEAMRVIAFRNRDHFYVSSVRLGVSDRVDSEAVALVFDKILQDQGVEPSEADRHVLGWASWGSWDVYMCLLHSLVEDYERVRCDHPSVVFPPLDDFLHSHQELVEELRAVRDKLLHPLKRADYQDSVGNLGIAARQVAPDLFLALEQLQGQLDDFLERLREVVLESLKNEVENLPPDEVAVYIHRYKEEIRFRAKRAGNAEVLADMDRQSGGLAAFEQIIRSYLSADFSLDTVGMGRIARLEETRNALSLPLPKRPYYKSADSVQTPVDANLAGWVLMSSFGGQAAILEQRLPANVMQHRGGILELLVRSVTIFNETRAAAFARYNTAHPDVPIETVMVDEESFMEAMRRSTPTDTDAELEQAMVEATQCGIALALLAEPLRIYRDLIRDTPELGREEIDSDTLDEAERVLRGFRSTIFHVPQGQADMFVANAELADAPINQGKYLDLVAGLTRFFQGTDPETPSEDE